MDDCQRRVVHFSKRERNALDDSWRRSWNPLCNAYADHIRSIGWSMGWATLGCCCACSQHRSAERDLFDPCANWRHLPCCNTAKRRSKRANIRGRCSWSFLRGDAWRADSEYPVLGEIRGFADACAAAAHGRVRFTTNRSHATTPSADLLRSLDSGATGSESLDGLLPLDIHGLMPNEGGVVNSAE